MDMGKDYYEVLGISRDASQEEIKNAFKKKAKQYHPDQSDDPAAEEKFKAISQAYEVLSDEEQRRRYDRYGEAGVNQQKRRQSTRGEAAPDIQQLLQQIFGQEVAGVQDLFRAAARQQGRRQKRGRKSKQETRIDLAVDFKTAVLGGIQQASVNLPVVCSKCKGRGTTRANPNPCPTCDGRGVVLAGGFFKKQRKCPDCSGKGVAARDRCSACDGRGSVSEEQTLNVDIPPGTKTGDRLVLQAEENGLHRGRRLVFEVTVQSHPRFERKGQDLIVEKPLDIARAALGGTVQIDHLDGSAKLNVPEGVQDGDTARIAQAGGRGQEGRGDLIVRFRITVPKTLNSEQRKALRAYQRAKTDPDSSPVSKEGKEQNAIVSMIITALVFLGLYDPAERYRSKS